MSKGPKNPERSFGLSVGGVLVLLAVILLWRRRITRAEVLGGIGAVLLVLGLLAPALLKYPSRYWWAFSLAFGRVMATFWLSLLFFIILTPVSVVWRMMGRDPLSRRRETWPGWSPYPERYRDRRHYGRMF
ncbi:MAG TPA: SxtJ family membrane protein [Vicinamibacterales bacterium]|nr:SxtJ family membrane protein [Vicinamibacterales bacterium]